MGLITETNYQYYEGSQLYLGANTATQDLVWTANTVLNDASTNKNANYVVETRAAGDNDFSLYPLANYSIVRKNVVQLTTAIPTDTEIKIRTIDPAKWDNYGSYEYVKLSEIINNFMNVYVGSGNVIPQARRSDVIFHAKRGLQEFSYDTLKSVKSQELTIPNSLSIIIPQDYVNYVSFFRIDTMGVQRPIYPANLLHQSPYQSPIQDGKGVPVQDDKSENLEGTSIADDRWKNLKDYKISGAYSDQMYNEGVYDWGWEKIAYGQRYGLTPETSQNNGWFNINDREGKIMFSSNLVNQVIIFHYISDGLAYDADMKIPKLAEEALYMHIAYGILSTKMNIPEYIVRRYKIERRAALRNAKIRLSNIKLDEIIQVMRNKSKWIKH